jgi:uncharacterized protein YjbJ (UPF0337 family)
MVDKNRIKGAAEDAAGKVEEAVGGLVGDPETEAAGKVRQAAGKFQNAYGKAADELRSATEYIIEAFDDQPVASLLVALAVGFFFGRLFVNRS